MSDNYSADSLSGTGAVTAPASGATIATVAIPQSGSIPSGITPDATYRVTVNTVQRGTIDTGHFAGLQVMHGSTVVGTIGSTDVDQVFEFPRINPGSDTDISVKAAATFAAASIVCATIIATRVG